VRTIVLRRTGDGAHDEEAEDAGQQTDEHKRERKLAEIGHHQRSASIG
jgi:hypothetical protein